MPLTGAGGVLGMSYQHPTAGERHALHLHLAHFDATPVTTSHGSNDRNYIGGGPVTPSESSVLETFASIAALWRTYFGPNWSLYVTELQQLVGDNLQELTPAPLTVGIAGADSSDDDSGIRGAYTFPLLGHSGVKRRLRLMQVKVPIMPTGPFEVAPTGGGLALRDQLWMAYLSGESGGGVVMPDGGYCFGVTDMHIEQARRLEPANWVLPGAPYMVTG